MSGFGSFVRRVMATAVAVAAAVTTLPATPATAFSVSTGVRVDAVEARLLTLINRERTARGIAALTLAPGYTDVARRWAASQSARNTLQHNPNLVAAVESTGGDSWRAIAENVGRAHGTRADSLFTSYMNSTGHRTNILNPKYRYVGIGWAERPDGYGYNTQVFVDSYDSAYGRVREPAYGGLADKRTFGATASLANFESGWDQRLSTAVSGSGLWSGGLGVETPGDGDQGARFTARESASGSGGYSELRLRDAMDLSNVRGLTVRVAAWTGSGRSVRLDVVLRTEFGGTVVLGSVTASPTTRGVTLTLPSAARGFRNHVAFQVSRTSLRSLSSTQSRRWATVAVKDVIVVV